MLFRCMFICITCLLVASCQDSEEEARTLLNQAMIEWADGQIESADKKFALIESEYLDTEVATEAIDKRAELTEEYKANYDITKARRSIRGEFSRTVFNKLVEYHSKNNTYPVALDLIDYEDGKEFLHLCDYEKGYFNSGFQLNCLKADQAYLQQQRSQRKHHAGQEHDANIPKVKSLDDFPKAKTTWANFFVVIVCLNFIQRCIKL